ncbi:hypothetical protein E4U45_000914 [Claviceps purpurea]|nr:hypothetical protein E4U45_000914 [Claviceps purpurea]
MNNTLRYPVTEVLSTAGGAKAQRVLQYDSYDMRDMATRFQAIPGYAAPEY